MSTPDIKQETDGVVDPDEWKQRQRIKAILDAREHVIEQKRKALDKRVEGQIGKQLAETMVRDAVEGYILESEQLIMSYLPDNDDANEWDNEEQLANEIWNTTELGTLEMATREKQFDGLSSYIEAPEMITEAWNEESQTAVGGRNTTRRTAEHQIPMHVSKAAYRELNRWWSQMGMDIEMDHKMPTDSL